MKGLTVGRMVHWVASPEWLQYVGKHLAAVVVDVCDLAAGKVRLNVMPSDGGHIPAQLATYSESLEPGTWHWIEPA